MSSVERLIGKQAPYFSMEAPLANGKHFVRVALPDYARKWLVLFFYPMDFTLVCPTELTAFSEHRETFHATGTELFNVGTDNVYTHQAWQRNDLGGLGYPMAADQTLWVCADYGVLLEEEGVALRGLFLIDPEQKVRYSVTHDNNIDRNSEEMFRVLTVLKAGGLYAAGWKAGEENLRPDISKYEAPMLAGTVPVHIYTMPGCSYCRSVKEFLRQGGTSYEKINLTGDKAERALIKSHGYTGLPVTVIDAEEIIDCDMLRIKTALGLSGANETK